MARNGAKIQEALIDPDRPREQGYIEYVHKGTTPAKGYFVTTYYSRDTDCQDCSTKAFKGQDYRWAKTDIYKTGLLHYLRVTETTEFYGWKVLIYIDEHSIESPVYMNFPDAARRNKHKSEWEQILKHPNAVFAIVHWPEYAVGKAQDGKTIDNAILRALRFKAFVDFPDRPVLLRDADTLFENLIKERDITQQLATWEATLLMEFKAIVAAGRGDILVASQPSYHRQWHVNPATGQKTTGCYAAITTVLGGIPEWKDGSLWRECLDYMRRNSKIIDQGGERVPDDLQKPTYIGKDEQLLSYVVIPKMMDRVYFYYFEYIHVEGGPIVDDPDFPFAAALRDAGFERYPSPYMEVRGEPYAPVSPTTSAKRKDENNVTEETILRPDIIKKSLDPNLNRMMHIVFGSFQKPGQKGGGHRHARQRQRQRPRRRTLRRAAARRARATRRLLRKMQRRWRGGAGAAPPPTTYKAPDGAACLIISADRIIPTLEILLNSCKDMGYSYKVVGLDQGWNTHKTKMRNYLRGLETYAAETADTPDAIALCVDGYDSICLRPAKDLLAAYKGRKRKALPVVFGAEKVCFANCKKMDAWFKKHGVSPLSPPGQPQLPIYLNSGLILGPPKEMCAVMRGMMDTGQADDQIAACEYVNANPDAADLDVEEVLFRNKNWTDPFTVPDETPTTGPFIKHYPGSFDKDALAVQMEELRASKAK